jgi:hypothetical protein
MLQLIVRLGRDYGQGVPLPKETPLTTAVRKAITEQIVPQLRAAGREALDRVGLSSNKINHYENKDKQHIPRSEFLLAALIELGLELVVANPSLESGAPHSWRVCVRSAQDGAVTEDSSGAVAKPLQLSLLTMLEGGDIGEPKIVRKAPGVVEFQLRLTEVRRAS